ncbi:hypothetical protein FM115_06950 [Marinilactibacillus psychrotolerans 42ea]|uniref:Uncharacterized protein n=1 Tax=Marinilactibacillus psychrotolerans 42ea TaxID=1255609 RepID=A0A1R4JV95_9LACT|nr:hypothetical protein FM115_06950 [Marinilactibacillus psychrotolerans 42ea]
MLLLLFAVIFNCDVGMQSRHLQNATQAQSMPVESVTTPI